MKSLLKEYRLEIIIIILTLAGLFFLFEPFGVRSIVWNTVLTYAAAGMIASKSMLDRLVNLLLNVSLIDLIVCF